jgi:vacuolar-type H+-ATPase subunit H
MKEDIIKRVREVENRAEQKIQEAQAEAGEIVREARRQAIEQRQNILEHAKQHAKESFAAGAKDIEPEVAEIHQHAEQNITNEAESARKQIASVVDFVVTTFHQQFGNG